MPSKEFNKIVKITYESDPKTLRAVHSHFNKMSEMGKINLDVAIKKGDIKRIERELNVVKKRTKYMAEDMESSISEALRKGSKRGTEKFLNEVHKASKGIGDLIQGSVEAVGNSLQSTGSSLARSATSAISKGIGKGLDYASDGLDEIGKKAGGISGGMMRGFGSVLGVASGMASSFAMVAQVLIDVEAKSKDLNRSLLEGGIASADLVDNAWDLYAALDAVRSFATDSKNNMLWGTLPEEQIQILNSFNSAGIALKNYINLSGTLNDQMKQYQSVTQVALTYAKMFGTQHTEMAIQQNKWAEELGGSLGFIEEQFALILDAAKSSGYNVKWFYSTIQQATSGVAIYNSRLSESAGMLIKMSRILGSQRAADRLASAGKEFTGTSIKDNIRTTLMAGQGKVQKAAEINEMKMNRDAVKKIGDIYNAGGKNSEDLKNAMGNLGVDIEQYLKTGKFTDKSGNELSEESLRKLASMTQGVMGGSVSREIDKLARAKDMTSGGILDLASNMDILSPQMQMYVKMNKAAAIFGKSIGQLEGMEEVAFQEATGMSGEEYRELRSVDQRMSADFDNIQQLSKEYATAGTSSERKGEIEKILKDTFGVMIDKQGKVFSQAGDAITSRDEYFMHVDVGIKEMTRQMDMNTQLAYEVATNTTDIGKILDMQIAEALERIYDVIGGLWDWFVKAWELIPGIDYDSSDELTMKEKGSMIETSRMKQEGFMKAIDNLDDEISKKEMDLSGETDVNKRKEIQAELDELNNKRAANVASLEAERKNESKITKATKRSELAFERKRLGITERHQKLVASGMESGEATSAIDLGRATLLGYAESQGVNISGERLDEATDALFDYMLELQRTEGISSADFLSPDNLAKYMKESGAANKILVGDVDVPGKADAIEDGMYDLLANTQKVGIDKLEYKKAMVDASASTMKHGADVTSMATLAALNEQLESGEITAEEHDKLFKEEIERINGVKSAIDNWADESKNGIDVQIEELKKNGTIYNKANDLLTKINKDLPSRIAKDMTEEQNRQLSGHYLLMNLLNESGGDLGSVEKLLRGKYKDEATDYFGSAENAFVRYSKFYHGKTPDQLTGLGGGMSMPAMPVQQAKDAIITPSGIVKTDPNDFILAMKPGGPLWGGGGGGGGGMNVTFNINGARDPKQVADEVIKILKEYNKYV